MGVKRFTVQEPSKGMHKAQAVPRENAVVEAEKGETMVTKGNHSNRKELVEIDGELHSNGGTPLAVEDGTLIFSDRLKIKDPVVLKFFRESGKKAKTFADISKKFDISKYQEELDDENIDKIRRESLEKNVEDANFKLSALFAMQEFHEKKGAPEEISESFIPFFERMGISPDELFGVGEADLQKPKEERQFTPLKRAAEGDRIELPKYDESNAFSKQGVEWLNTFLKDYGIDAVDVNNYNREGVLAKVREAQRLAVEQNPDLVFDFMSEGTERNKSHRPNNKLQEIMKGVEGAKGSGSDGTFTNEDLRAMLKDGTITTDQVLDAYQDNKWWYRMVTDRMRTVSQEQLDALKPLLEQEGITQNGITYLYKENGIYEAYKVNDDGSIDRVEAKPPVLDEPYEWKGLKHIQERPDDRNMDYRWDHKRALAQARKNKNTIPYLRPFTPIADTFYADQAYYNPDQAINQVKSMVQGQSEKQAMFAGPQGQLANFLAGQQFDMVSKLISQYEDKNVAAYNRESLTNTQIANRASENLRNAIEGHHDKTTILKQSYANARRAADNNIAENEIAMWNERRNRINLEESIGEQFRTDPNTGLHVFNKGKDFYPQQGTQKDIADTFADLKKRLPGVSDAEINKMAMAIHSGKYEVQNNTVPPNEQQYEYPV